MGMIPHVCTNILLMIYDCMRVCVCLCVVQINDPVIYFVKIWTLVLLGRLGLC
jgi:hypothetical protein